MASLGELGTPHAAADITFGYFGTTVRANPALSNIAVTEAFAEIGALDMEKIGGAETLDAIRQLALTLVHADDAAEFWATAKANGQGMEDIAGLAVRLLEALTERPTVLPSDSSDGQPNDATSSEAASSLPALRLLAGRPDLQVAVLRASA